MKIIRIEAMWCPACLIMKKIWPKINEEYPNVSITEYDYDLDNDIVISYNPGKLLPVIIFLDENNTELSRLIGEQDINVIRNEIDKYVK